MAEFVRVYVCRVSFEGESTKEHIKQISILKKIEMWQLSEEITNFFFDAPTNCTKLWKENETFSDFPSPANPPPLPGEEQTKERAADPIADGAELPAGHRGVGLVLQAGHGAVVAVVACDPWRGAPVTDGGKGGCS